MSNIIYKLKNSSYILLEKLSNGINNLYLKNLTFQNISHSFYIAIIRLFFNNKIDYSRHFTAFFNYCLIGWLPLYTSRVKLTISNR